MNNYITIIRNWGLPIAADFAGDVVAPCTCDPGGFRPI